MKEKIEKELIYIKEQKDRFLKLYDDNEKQKQDLLLQIISCNGAIQTLEKLLKEEK